MRLIESLLANLNRESRLAKYIESAQLYCGSDLEVVWILKYVAGQGIVPPFPAPTCVVSTSSPCFEDRIRVEIRK